MSWLKLLIKVFMSEFESFIWCAVYLTIFYPIYFNRSVIFVVWNELGRFSHVMTHAGILDNNLRPVISNKNYLVFSSLLISYNHSEVNVWLLFFFNLFIL